MDPILIVLLRCANCFDAVCCWRLLIPSTLALLIFSYEHAHSSACVKELGRTYLARWRTVLYYVSYLLCILTRHITGRMKKFSRPLSSLAPARNQRPVGYLILLFLRRVNEAISSRHRLLSFLFSPPESLQHDRNINQRRCDSIVSLHPTWPSSLRTLAKK